MDGCSQMVFCTHLSDTADRGREGRKGDWAERGRKGGKKGAFIDHKVQTLVAKTDLQ